MNDCLIEINNLSKSFSNKIVLKNINLKIRKNDFIAILGESGAGKSTLLSILAQYDKPTSGYIIYNDLIDKNKISCIFQDYKLIPKRTIEDNILMPRLYNDGYSAIDNIIYESVLNELNLYDIRNNKIDVLSGGEKQRVAIARAILTKPLLLLADEPTGNLDDDNAMKVMDLLKKYNAEGISIILITHSKEIAKYAKTVYYLSNGLLKEKYI